MVRVFEFVFEVAKGFLMALGLGVVLYSIYSGVRSKLECWGAPAEVEFHQGMTICPGQSARMHITIPFGGGDDERKSEVFPKL